MSNNRNFRLNPNWREQNIRCYFCGTANSVKYLAKIVDPVISTEETEVCCCNRCVTQHTKP